MPDQHDRRRSEVHRADRQVTVQAAAQLRQGAIRVDYAGLPGKHFAFALALVLDERHLRDLTPLVRAQVVIGVWTMLTTGSGGAVARVWDSRQQ